MKISAEIEFPSIFFPLYQLQSPLSTQNFVSANISIMAGWYTRSSRFIFDAFGRHHYRTSAFGSSSRISHNLVYQQSSPFVDDRGKRFYSGDRRKIKHPIISALAMAGCVVVGGVEILQFLEKDRFSQETVPYTNRKQFLLYSVSQERAVAWKVLEAVKSELKGRIMAPHHPMCIRAQKIGGDIVEVVKSQNAHLNELEWEFIVVDEPTSLSANGLPGGKIVVPSCLLNRFRRDDEVAAFIAIAVGNVVARHFAEQFSDGVRERHSRAILMLILSPFCDSYGAERLLELPGDRRMNLEADYIGLLLMAYAGYDPRVAPRLWEKLGSKGAWDEFVAPRFSGETRARLLLQPEVIDGALSIYREARARRGIEAEKS